jgi:hypothetical protein
VRRHGRGRGAVAPLLRESHYGAETFTQKLVADAAHRLVVRGINPGMFAGVKLHCIGETVRKQVVAAEPAGQPDGGTEWSHARILGVPS